MYLKSAINANNGINCKYGWLDIKNTEKLTITTKDYSSQIDTFTNTLLFPRTKPATKTPKSTFKNPKTKNPVPFPTKSQHTNLQIKNQIHDKLALNRL